MSETEPGPSTSSDDPDNPKNEKRDEKGRDDQMYECNICLDTAKDAVISMCGHLFCWPCLHQWLETRPNKKLCPVCKSGISADKVIPLYGRGSGNQEDPRKKVPPRPSGQRAEPEQTMNFPGFSFGDGSFHLSLGIGAFPFGLFTSAFNFTNNPHAHAAGPMPGYHFEQDQLISKLFLWIAALFILWIIFM